MFMIHNTWVKMIVTDIIITIMIIIPVVIMITILIITLIVIMVMDKTGKIKKDISQKCLTSNV